MPSSMEFSQAYEAKKNLSAQLLQSGRGEGLTPRTRSIEAAVAIAAERRNVHAVGIGRKFVAGQPTDTLAVRIYVSQKLPLSVVGDFLLPESIDGVPTDVIESPPAFLLPAAATQEESLLSGLQGISATNTAPAPCSSNRRRRQRPVVGGISTGHVAITAGTIGYFCRSTRAGDDPEQICVLSNNHVYADLDKASPEDTLLQQGTADGGTSADRIAAFVRSVPLLLGGTAVNRVDAAIGSLDPGVPFDPSICSIGRITGITSAFEGQRVRKHGRTTGLTEGEIADLSYDPLVGMDHLDSSVVALFEDQLLIVRRPPHTVFGLGGDSGSLVVTNDASDAVGLYFAGPNSGHYGVANPIADVLQELEISLI